MTKGGAIEQSHDSDVTGRHVMALLLLLLFLNKKDLYYYSK